MTGKGPLPPPFVPLARPVNDIRGRLTEARERIDDASTEAALDAAENNELVKTAAGRVAALSAREAEMAMKRRR